MSWSSYTSGNTAFRLQMPEPRFQVRLAIYCGIGEGQLMTDYAVNMSTGGMFIETHRIFPVDTPLHVEFMLPFDDAVIGCMSRVAWTNEPGDIKSPSLPPGMGVQFLNLALKDVRAIRNFINESGLLPTW